MVWTTSPISIPSSEDKLPFISKAPIRLDPPKIFLSLLGSAFSWMDFITPLSSKKIISRYSYSSEFILNDFESDDILLNKEMKISIDTSGKYSLENLIFRGGKSQQNSAFKIESNGRSNIELIFNNKINKFSNLGFDISNTLDSTNFKIILYNKARITDTINLNLFNTSIELKNYKFDYLTKKRFKKINDINFKTYSIDINENDISSFSFQFNDSAKFYLDNIVLY